MLDGKFQRTFTLPLLIFYTSTPDSPRHQILQTMNKSISLLNKTGNQLLVAACAFLVLGDLSYANPTIEKTSDIIYSKSVVFQEFHDSGRLISANGKEYYFYYKGFTYDNIKTWEEGRKLNLTYSNTKGSQLHDPISGASARVKIPGSHLIEEIIGRKTRIIEVSKETETSLKLNL